ncbi:MAG TPA: NAD(P)H-binding protein [Actinomycetota bacterium]|nr:NAD(P)H-binding protein [Actinomycetota bacterium]
MPVLVTGATGLVGRALVAQLLSEGGQVRAYVRREDAALRAAGAHLAIGAMDDVPRLESALTRAHTIVHLIGGVWPEPGMSYDLLNRDSTEAAVISAHAADVKRFIFLSFVGADPASPNEFLAAKGRAELHITASPMEHVILRCAPLREGLGPTLESLGRGRGAGVPGRGNQRINPVSLRDVVAAIVAADAREAAVNGTWELGGPETMTMAEAASRALPAARLVRPARGAPKALTDLYGRDMVADPTTAVEQFGLTLTR